MQVVPKMSVSSRRKYVIVVCGIAMAIAAGLYFMPGVQTDAAGLDDGKPATIALSGGSDRRSDAAALPSVEDMVQQLELRLQAEPDDAKGWGLLGRSYEYLGRHQDAIEAYGRARALGYKTPAVIVQSGSINGTVTLDSSLQDLVPAKGTVFIFARAVSGPRMPLAAVRKPLGRFPVEFSLDDSMSMSPSLKISDFNEVIVGARISVSGDATAHEGDLEGFSSVVRVNGDKAVAIKIDQERLVSALKLRDYGAVRNNRDE